jgi:hypothetical protein
VTTKTQTTPAIVQGELRANMDVLSVVSDFGFVKLFKDGSGALYDDRGREIAGFFDVKDLQRISETRLEALNQYDSHVERRRVAAYNSDDPKDRQGVTTLNSRWKFWGQPGPEARDNGHPMVVQDKDEADLRLLAYFSVFTSVNLNPDGSGSVRDFNEAVLERFDGIADLHETLATNAMKKRLQGAGKY